MQVQQIVGANYESKRSFKFELKDMHAFQQD